MAEKRVKPRSEGTATRVMTLRQLPQQWTSKPGPWRFWRMTLQPMKKELDQLSRTLTTSCGPTDIVQEEVVLDAYASESETTLSYTVVLNLGWPSKPLTTALMKLQTQHTEWKAKYAPLFPRSSCTTRAHLNTCLLNASTSPPIAPSPLVPFLQLTRASSMP
jgi:hypothetical protein